MDNNQLFDKTILDKKVNIHRLLLVSKLNKKVNKLTNKLIKKYNNQKVILLGNVDKYEKLNKNYDLKHYYNKRAMINSYAKGLFLDENQTSEYLEQFSNEIKAINDRKNTFLSSIAYLKETNVDNSDETVQKLATIEKEILQEIAEYKNNLQIELENDLKLYEEKITEKAIAKNKNNVIENDIELDEDVILKVEGLSMHFGGLKAVDDLSFEVKKGEVFGLIGPNGAGKTTVFNCITQFYKSTYGNVYFNNGKKVKHLNNIKVHDIIKEGIARTFQNIELNMELTVLENILVAGHVNFKSSLANQMFNSKIVKLEENIQKEKAEKILDFLGLTAYKNRYAYGLPYGVLKNIELARTLMCDPKLIILDEPAAGLNDSETDVLNNTILKIKNELGITIFLVEHDMGLVMSVCDHICAISFGKLLKIGTPQEIQSSKEVQEAYLGVDE